MFGLFGKFCVLWLELELGLWLVVDTDPAPKKFKAFHSINLHSHQVLLKP